MTLQSPTTAWLVASTIALMIVTPWANAGDTVERTQQDQPRLMAKDANWSLRLPKDDKVTYKGEVSFDAAGTASGTMMYPAPGAVGLLAAVITHGILVEYSKQNQKNKLQEASDKVLLPYQAVLSSYEHKELMQRGLEMTSTGAGMKLVHFSEKPGADWSIGSTPIFSMTQDESAIILDNSISIYTPDAPSEAAYQYTVRVVSRAKDETDLAGFWTANEGEKLKNESASLFAQSLDIALSEAASGSSKNNNAYRTIRYLQGNTERMERGQLISERCNRVVIKTLRGGSFMSVPTRGGAAPTATDDQCANVPGTSK